jgi:hypothetical protein
VSYNVLDCRVADKLLQMTAEREICAQYKARTGRLRAN